MQFLRDRVPRGGYDLLVVFTADALGKGLALVTSLFIVKLAAPEQMGIFSLFLAIQNVLVLMTDLGLNVALVNYVARPDVEAERRIAFLKAGLTLKLALVVLLAAPLYGLAPWLLGSLLHKPTHIEPLRYACVATLGAALLSFSTSYYQSLQRFRSLSALRIGESLVRFMGIVALTTAVGMHLAGVMSVYALAPLGVGIIGILGPARVLGGARARRHEVVALLSYSKWIVIAALAGSLAQQLDVLLLSWLATPAEVGSYGAAQRLVMPLPILMNAVTTVLLPRALQRRTAADLRGLYRRSLRLTAPLAIALGGACVAGAPLLFRFFPQYHGAPVAFQILAVAFAASLILNPASLVLYALNRPDLVAWTGVGQVALAFASNGLLIPRFGVLGAALSAGLTWVGCGGAYFVCARHLLSREDMATATLPAIQPEEESAWKGVSPP